jgi:hypothetical protein
VHSLKVILYNIWNDFVHETEFRNVDISTCDVTEALKKIRILEHFWIWDFQPRSSFYQWGIEAQKGQVT